MDSISNRIESNGLSIAACLTFDFAAVSSFFIISERLQLMMLLKDAPSSGLDNERAVNRGGSTSTATTIVR